MKRFCLLTLLVSALFPCVLLGQSSNASITGVVDDPSKAVIPGVSVTAINASTGIKTRVATNKEGVYVITGLIPGTYRVEVDKQGFKGIIEAGLVLHVQDIVQINFHMAVGSMTETISVSSEGVNINTTDGSVSTVIDREFVENIPLNGRSFQTLLYLTPGVNANLGPGAGGPNGGAAQGQFVVNGQRGDANTWYVDGVSANIGMSTSNPGNSLGGSVGATNVLGGTSALVPVDALEEFRIETSSYAPEYGDTPGGQVNLETRAGTNRWTGTLFEYLRNTDFDAFDWFAKRGDLPKGAEHQNDFGGVLGGPILKDKAFFFFDYEGLRLLRPHFFGQSTPTTDFRNAAPPALQPFLAAYPLPQPGALATPGLPGFAQYYTNFSLPSSADAVGLRVDYALNDKLKLFARYAHSPSTTEQRGNNGSTVNTVYQATGVTKEASAGLTWSKSAHVVNDSSFGYSLSGGHSHYFIDSYGGGTPPPFDSVFPPGTNYKTAMMEWAVVFGGNMWLWDGVNNTNYNYQYFVGDNLAVNKGTHALKFGVEYSRLSPSYFFNKFQMLPIWDSASEWMSNQSNSSTPLASYDITYGSGVTTFLIRSMGFYAQDTWRLGSRLNLTYGLRGTVHFRPVSEVGPSLLGVTGFNPNDLSNLAEGSLGKPPYDAHIGWAPRVGGAYRLRTDANWGLVLRGGFGLFYSSDDTEIGNAAIANYPFLGYTFVGGTFPPARQTVPPIVAPNASNGETLFAFDPNLTLPKAYEWNVALDQSLGAAQTLTVTYVGAADRGLLATANVVNPNPNYANATVVGNVGTMDYEALQTQFQRRMSRGMQALVSYSWSHTIDEGSYGAYVNGGLTPGSARQNRGNADYDLRHVFSGAFDYYVPTWKINAFTRAVTRGWSTDNIVSFRTGPPVDIQDQKYQALLLASDLQSIIHPDRVPGVPLWIHSTPGSILTEYAGGKSINPAAFQDPPLDPTTGLPARQGNVGRNTIPAFGLEQWDFAAHREFDLGERLKLQFRGELFNILNHPNFGPFNHNFGTDPGFGQSQSMLNQWSGGIGQAGSGAQDPLYSQGGPRSGELALKLIF